MDWCLVINKQIPCVIKSGILIDCVNWLDNYLKTDSSIYRDIDGYICRYTRKDFDIVRCDSYGDVAYQLNKYGI